MRPVYPPKYRYYGLFKQEWFSVCNNHRWKEDCKTCQVGYWENKLIRKFNRFMCKYCPNIWYWWHNRPNSKSMKFVRRVVGKPNTVKRVG